MDPNCKPAPLPPSFCAQEFPIPFASKVKKMDKVDGIDVDMTELIKLDFFMGPDNPA
jgi:hypothetical protein